jgi:hypothetical protein
MTKHTTPGPGDCREAGAWARRLAIAAAGCVALGAIASWAIVAPTDRHALNAWLLRPGIQAATKAIWLADIWRDGLGMIAILLLVATLDPRGGVAATLASIARTAAIALAPGALGDGIDWALRFVHPSQAYPCAWLAGFAGRLPDAVSRLGPANISSLAAAATAMSLAMAGRYPRGKFLFGAFGAMAIAGRGLFYGDTPPDLLYGVALGCAWTAICVHPRLLGGAFQILERRYACVELGVEARREMQKRPASGRGHDVGPPHAIDSPAGRGSGRTGARDRD